MEDAGQAIADFSNWIIYVTVKHVRKAQLLTTHFSNWIIYVTVKPNDMHMDDEADFSNWIIYVTVKLLSLSW